MSSRPRSVTFSNSTRSNNGPKRRPKRRSNSNLFEPEPSVPKRTAASVPKPIAASGPTLPSPSVPKRIAASGPTPPAPSPHAFVKSATNSSLNVLYKIGPLLLVLLIAVGTLLLPSLATCSPNWDEILYTFGMRDRIVVIG